MEHLQEHEVVLTPQPDGGFTVSFPGFTDVFTEGDTREEALAMASDAIDGYLEVMRDQAGGSSDEPEEVGQEGGQAAGHRRTGGRGAGQAPPVPGLTPARRRKQPAGKPLKTKGTVSDLRPEQRR